MQNDLKEQLLASVAAALESYAKDANVVAGIHLIGYAKNGLITAKSSDDAALLRNLSGPFPQSQNFYIFLRKVAVSAFAADSEAITKLFSK
jgi:hypothetical protein